MININHPSRPSHATLDSLPRHQSINNRRCMEAIADLANYIAENANYQLAADSSYARCAFLDDDSDYIPAAIEMMTALTNALSADYTEMECDLLLARIATNRQFPISHNALNAYPHSTDDLITADELPLDAPTSLPIPDYDY